VLGTLVPDDVHPSQITGGPRADQVTHRGVPCRPRDEVELKIKD